MSFTSLAEESEHQADQMKHHKMMKHLDDGRISLGLPPHMKTHQLANMRAHLEAVQTIIGYIGDGKFDAASDIAHSQLGINDEMKEMCSRIGNEHFKELGLKFHESGDTLGEVLKTKDTTKSLRALKTTMNYCIQCHATFRQ